MNCSPTSATGIFVPLALPAILAAAMGSMLAVSGRPLIFGLAATSVLAYAIFGLIALRNPLILVVAILVTLEAVPPLYLDRLGGTPLYVSFLLLPIALAVIAIRFPHMRVPPDPVARGLAAFIVPAGLSIPFAFWLSGTAVGVSSLSRWVLLGHAALIYGLIRGGARHESSWTEQRMFGLLLAGAVFAGAYGVLDFMWPIPLPHPAADQFIWLEGVILRRAQGPFYESSSFANLCGFFLVIMFAAWLRRRERDLGLSRSVLFVFIVILTLAILLTFSRSTWAGILTALACVLVLTPSPALSRVLVALGAIVLPLSLLWVLSPELWEYLISARLLRLFDIATDPNAATSGRFETWIRVLSIMRDEPQYLFFGIGYKALPVTRLFHEEIITDNGYLSLLLETGLAGLGGFLVFSAATLRVFLRAARSAHEATAFWASVLFSIWCGEMVLFLAADAYTYWRNISVLAALMALTLNLKERADLSGMGS